MYYALRLNLDLPGLWLTNWKARRVWGWESVVTPPCSLTKNILTPVLKRKIFSGWDTSDHFYTKQLNLDWDQFLPFSLKSAQSWQLKNHLGKHFQFTVSHTTNMYLLSSRTNNSLTSSHGFPSSCDNISSWSSVVRCPFWFTVSTTSSLGADGALMLADSVSILSFTWSLALKKYKINAFGIGNAKIFCGNNISK